MTIVSILFVLVAFAPGALLVGVASGGWGRVRKTGLVIAATAAVAAIGFQIVADRATGWDDLLPAILALTGAGFCVSTMLWMGLLWLIRACGDARD